LATARIFSQPAPSNAINPKATALHCRKHQNYVDASAKFVNLCNIRQTVANDDRLNAAKARKISANCPTQPEIIDGNFDERQVQF